MADWNSLQARLQSLNMQNMQYLATGMLQYSGALREAVHCLYGSQQCAGPCKWSSSERRPCSKPLDWREYMYA